MKNIIFAFTLFPIFAIAATENVVYPYVNNISVTQQNAILGQVGTIAMTLSTDSSCKVTLGSSAKVEKVASMAHGQTMDAIVITVFSVVENCEGSWVLAEKTVSAKTEDLIVEALKTITHEKKEMLPKLLRLPEVSL